MTPTVYQTANWSPIFSYSVDSFTRLDFSWKQIGLFDALFLGDGMDIATVTAGRILKGQLQGKNGEETKLAMDQFQHAALSRVGYFEIVWAIVLLLLSFFNSFTFFFFLVLLDKGMNACTILLK